MIQIPEQILLLIEKRLKGQPSETEMEQLQQWRSESKSHETIYRQLEKYGSNRGSYYRNLYMMQQMPGIK
jgi:ferric-dicitrate binding protein FerR (iron transport regulator)